MCGVVAAWSRQPSARIDLDPALRALHHRGPDGSGTYHSPDSRFALGHVRLAVMAPDDGAQPIASESGEVVAVVNGEFYGAAALRRDLSSRGHRFRTRSDSEVLVHLYEEYGSAATDHLRGEFAFVLVDRAARRIVAGRDRFGVKPLVFARTDAHVLIASEAKALFALGVRARWDHRSFAHVLTHQYLPPGRTLFEGVSSLEASHLLIVEDDGKTITRRYADPLARRDAALLDEDAAVATTRRILEESVRLRLEADAKIAFHLSGGLDSAAIVALAARANVAPIMSYSVSFEHGPWDESDSSATIARFLGVERHEVKITQDDLLEGLPEAVRMSEGLCSNGQLPAKRILAAAIARDGFKVALSGEGSDEAFFGYAHLATDAGALQSASASAVSEMQRGVMLPDGPMVDAAPVRRRYGFVPTFLASKCGIGARFHGLLRDDLDSASFAERTFEDLVASLQRLRDQGGHSRLEVARALWMDLALEGYILKTLGDGTEMAASIEGRTPFLDHGLFEHLAAVPIDRMIRNGVTKHLLRRAVADLLPESITTRPKQPFLAPPIVRFASPEARRMISERLDVRALERLPWLDAAKTRACIEDMLAPRGVLRPTDDPVLMLLLSAVCLQEAYDL